MGALEQTFLPWQQLNFNMKIIFITLVTTTLSVSIEGENFDPHCEGSLNIFDTSGNEHSFAFTKDDLNKLAILNATVHGCGCFRIHKFNKGRGQSMFMSSGDVFTEEDLDFKYIRSVRKEKCNPEPVPRAATKIDYMPSLEIFFMIVAGSLMFISIILFFICCKLYCCLRRSKRGEKYMELQRLCYILLYIIFVYTTMIKPARKQIQQPNNL